MDRRKKIKEYKNTVLSMGIVQVRNVKNGRIYLSASANMTGTMNSIRFQLRMGSFLPCPELAKDWRDLGEDSFVIEVLDELKPVNDDPGRDYQEDLKELEKIWREKLRPDYR
jgi:hypothetical protein